MRHRAEWQATRCCLADYQVAITVTRMTANLRPAAPAHYCNQQCCEYALTHTHTHTVSISDTFRCLAFVLMEELAWLLKAVN